MTKDTGGPAFPHTVEYKGADCGGVVPHGGMSLRDYFAAKAMPLAMNSCRENFTKDLPDDWHWEEEDWERIAFHSYEMADAMLKARQA